MREIPGRVTVEQNRVPGCGKRSASAMIIPPGTDNQSGFSLRGSCGISTSVPGTTMADHGARKGRADCQKSLLAPSPDDSGHQQRAPPCRHCESCGFPSRKNPSRSDDINAYRQIPVLEKEPAGGGITYFTS